MAVISHREKPSAKVQAGGKGARGERERGIKRGVGEIAV